MKISLLSVYLVFAIGFTSCNNSGKNSMKPGSSAGSDAPGVNNVNGNMPDTNNSVNLNKSLPIDSSKLRDSLNVRQ